MNLLMGLNQVHIVEGIPDLNVFVGPVHHNGPPQQAHQEIQADHTGPEIGRDPVPDNNLDAILAHREPENTILFMDPMQQELLAISSATTPQIKDDTMNSQLDVEVDYTNDTAPGDQTNTLGNKIDIIRAPDVPQQEKTAERISGLQGESPSFDSDAPPPGFPVPQFKDHNQNLLVRFVHLPTMSADPVIMERENNTCLNPIDEDEALLGKEGALIWKKHFAPTEDSKEVIQVPIEWVNFLYVALLSPRKFDWAKKFLTSQVWNYILQGSETKICKPFAIPECCTSTHTSSCLSQIQQMSYMEKADAATPTCTATSGTTLTSSSTSAMHMKRKRKDKVPLVETEVRRSCRLQALNKGFKKAVCSDRNCMACNAIPPPLPSKVIKNLSYSFCKVNQVAAEKGLKQGNKKTKSNGYQAGTKSSKARSNSQE